jgi:hypothetical protein
VTIKVNEKKMNEQERMEKVSRKSARTKEKQIIAERLGRNEKLHPDFSFSIGYI